MAKILIMGVGGIGGFLGGHLHQSGHDVTLVCRNPEITDALNAHGLILCERGKLCERGRSEAATSLAQGPVTAVSTLDELPAEATYDYALLAMKADSVVAAAPDAAARLLPGGFVVTLQNGMVEDGVARAVGENQVVAATIGWGATMHGPGRYEKTSPGKTFVGELDGRVRDRTERLAEHLRHVSPVVVSKNIRGVKWSKLAINATINPLGGILGQPLGDIVQRQQAREVLLDLYAEVYRTALAHDVVLERVAAPPGLLYRSPNAGKLQNLFKHFAVRAIGKIYGGARSSLLQSLERGRKTEIDALNGYVVACAAERGLDVPLNRAVVSLVHALERGEKSPGPENLALLTASS